MFVRFCLSIEWSSLISVFISIVDGVVGFQVVEAVTSVDVDGNGMVCGM